MERKPYPSETQERFIVRFPDGMRERIADAAKANNRSMNAEVVARLEGSFSSQPSSPDLRLAVDTYIVSLENRATVAEMRLEVARYRLDSLTVRARYLVRSTDFDLKQVSDKELERIEADIAELEEVEHQIAELRDEMELLRANRESVLKSLSEMREVVSSKLEVLEAALATRPPQQ